MHALSKSRANRARNFLYANRRRLLEGYKLHYNGRVFWVNQTTRQIYYLWESEEISGRTNGHLFGVFDNSWNIALA